MVELALYALLAVFIFSRLYSSLGKTSNSSFNSLQLGPSINEKFKIVIKENNEDHLQDEVILNSFEEEKSNKIRTVLNNIRAKDKNFSLTFFSQGASTAFEMIMKAFNDNDKNILQLLMSDKLYRSFVKEIDKRKKLEQIHQNIVISLSSPEIIEVGLVKNIGCIVVKFISKQVNFVKDNNENILSGSISKTNKIEDFWQFKRDLTSSSQKWILFSTNYKSHNK